MTEDRERGPLDFEEEPAPARSPPLAAPETDRGAPSPAAPGGHYLWVVGAGAILLVAVLLLATLRHGTERGARGVPDGDVMPAFAVPTALGTLDGDANVAQGTGEGQAGHEPACTVRGSDVLNGCALREAGPVVLAFFTVRSGKCINQLDAMEQVRRRLAHVGFAAVAIRGDRDDLRALIRRHGWRFPIGYDRDGAVAGTYHVQVCPQLTFARRGGRVVDTTFGTIGVRDLTAKARSLGP